jgi:hypothetical protein
VKAESKPYTPATLFRTWTKKRRSENSLQVDCVGSYTKEEYYLGTCRKYTSVSLDTTTRATLQQKHTRLDIEHTQKRIEDGARLLHSERRLRIVCDLRKIKTAMMLGNGVNG